MAINLFEWLVNYHMKVGLAKCLPKIVTGRMLDEEGQPLIEGSDKKTPHDGFLIVANGDTLVNRLKEEKVIHDDNLGQFECILNEDNFRKYIQLQREMDGAFIFDGVNEKIVRVDEINNNVALPDGKTLYDMVPYDFFSYRGETGAFGTKTRLAIRLPHGYDNTETYQIKRSSYANLGMGKVTHFNRQGLAEEFFMMHDPNNKGPFVMPEESIIGVYRRYRRNAKDRLVRVVQKQIERDVADARHLQEYALV